MALSVYGASPSQTRPPLVPEFQQVQFPLDDLNEHAGERKMCVGYPDKCRACQMPHAGTHEIGPASNEDVAGIVPDRPR